VPEAVTINYDVPAAWLGDDAAPDPSPSVADHVNGPAPETQAPAPVRRRLFTARRLAAVFAAIALVEAAAIGRFLMLRPAATAGTATAPAVAASVPVTIESPDSGDVVMVDGRQVGLTPLALAVSPSMRSIRVLARPVPPVVSSPAAAPLARSVETGGRAVASAPGPAAARTLSGRLRVSSPIELQVLEDERVLGSSVAGPIAIGAGVHQLDLVNSALGYRSRQTVQIKAGQVFSLRVQPPDGRLSINALPWAQVWIDGKPMGDTPLANLPVAVGEHEIIFRHPQLGERRETTIVKSDAMTRVSATRGP
jgi:hypothetical protein